MAFEAFFFLLRLSCYAKILYKNPIKNKSFSNLEAPFIELFHPSNNFKLVSKSVRQNENQRQ